ncbi:MAG: putative nucleic acid-binding protein [Bacteriovoracaceae bacterium]|jgi:predicted nucleic acid-binding protein
MKLIQDHIDLILQVYTKDKHYEDLKNAKEAYIKRTGKIDEETDEYESRMNSFNDWYIFNYKREDGSTIIGDYVQNHDVEDNLGQALLNTKYSLYHFSKINFRKQVVIKDVLYSVKFVLSKDNDHLALVEDDLFVGRSVCIGEDHYLLNGLCTLPREVLSSLKKESKKIRKLNNVEEEEVFLLNLERLKTRSIQYGHIESSKIFTF